MKCLTYVLRSGRPERLIGGKTFTFYPFMLENERGRDTSSSCSWRDGNGGSLSESKDTPQIFAPIGLSVHDCRFACADAKQLGRKVSHCCADSIACEYLRPACGQAFRPPDFTSSNT